MPTLPPHFHVGIVVPDVLAARAHLTELLGVAWGPVMHLDEVEYRDADGNDLVLPTTISYTTGEPALEVIQERPGTVWERNEHSNLHHLGVWTDDLVGDSGTFGAGACPLQLAGRAGDDAPISFAYHRDEALGVRFELVDATWRDAMAFLWQPDAAEG
jgi:catechol 2,3-dioxygenase-like lactoylglutathione lyase family enzyme